MAENKKSFLLYCDIIHTVNQLNDEQAGKLFRHVLRYVNDENPETNDVIINIAFEPIKQSLKRDLQKYESIRERNSKNALMRWHATACDRIPNDAKNADSDSDSDSDSDINKKKKRFVKPFEHEVREYMATLNMDDLAQQFVDFYESNGWKVGKNSMKDWKAAVRTWNKRHTPKQNASPYKKLTFEDYVD
jgi:hypothetical protein